MKLILNLLGFQASSVCQQAQLQRHFEEEMKKLIEHFQVTLPRFEETSIF